MLRFQPDFTFLCTVFLLNIIHVNPTPDVQRENQKWKVNAQQTISLWPRFQAIP